MNKSLRNIKVEVELGFDVGHRVEGGAALPELRRADGVQRRPVHRVRRLRRHLPDRLHHLHRTTATRPTCARGCARRRATPSRRCTSRTPLKTGRVMVKDEDVCLHCGLCAERCPTGAWDMQKFLLDLTAGRARLPHAARRRARPTRRCTEARSPHRSRQRLRRQVRQRQRLGLGVGQRAVRAQPPAHGRAGQPAQHLPVATSRACRPGTRCASAKPASSAGAAACDLMVAMNPQTWDQDVAEIEPGGYLLYDTRSRCRRAEFRDDIHVIGVPLTDLCATRYTDPRERQLLKNIVYVGVLAALLGIEPEVIATLLGEQYKGKAKLIQPNLDAFMIGPAPRPRVLRRRARPADRARATRSASASSSKATPPPRSAASTAAPPCAPGTRSRRRSSLAEAFQKYCRKLRVDKATGKQQVRDRAGRGRDRVDRHRHRRRLERRARVHRHLGAGRVADDRVHRPGVLRRDPGDDHRRAARRPVHRHADAHAAGRPARAAPTRRTATPSTCCCSPRTRTSASSSPPRRSTSPTGCRRRCS